MKATISRIFVANRGEIAVRIIKACKELGIESVLGVSEADRKSLPAEMADQVICIGGPRSTDSYLKINTIVWAAIKTNCQAIHPGYGFLAERYELAELCEENGLIFIGPSSRCIQQMGNKLFARQIAKECGISIIPGSEMVKDLPEALACANEIKYPVMIKAAAGGGGRGIKVVRDPDGLRGVFNVAKNEAEEAFGEGTLYLEHYVANARHIEVQIAGDSDGNVIHLGERDCSLQRRYQKMIEEAPAYSIPESMRKDIHEASVAIAKKIGYKSMGTVEFVFDQDKQQFYFLEMNTRIQVEHPVTEMISGIDLVKEQIRIAALERLILSQRDLTITGHAIECRITAESPDHGFQPSPGRITNWILPHGPNIRVDTHCYPGYFVSPYYDSLLAKLITWGEDREQAIETMRKALDNFLASGIETTIPVLAKIMKEPDYKNNLVHTKWVEAWLDAQ